MPDVTDFALMSGAAYKRTRNSVNEVPYPANWSLLEGALAPKSDDVTGFSARAFIDETQSKIVIAYAGTYSGDVFPGAKGDLIADAMLGLGQPNPQLLQAARYYEDIKAQYPDAEIIFTGHSLGGGLAAVMSVFFNRSAVVFDAAPFRLAALPDMAGLVQAELALHGYADLDLDAYIASAGAILPAREDLITNIAVRDEFLSSDPNLGLSGPSNLLRLGNATSYLEQGWGAATLEERTDDLHSIALLIALQAEPALQTLSTEIPHFLQAFFNPTNAYVSPTDLAQQNLLELLIQHQFGTPDGTIAPDGMLDGLVHELGKLTEGGAAQTLNEGLARALLDAYYRIGSYGPDSEVLKGNGGGWSFDVASLGPSFTSASAYGPLAAALRTNYQLGAAGFPLGLADSERFYIQDGSTPLTASGTALDETLVGGATNDVLNGDAGTDILLGGGGADMLNGGAGDDKLLGGVGHDRYEVVSGEGTDRIYDADGAGEIWFDGLQLTGGKSIDANQWQSADGRFFYSLVGDGSSPATLIVTTATGTGRVVITNFVSGQLGISLSTEAREGAAQPIDNEVLGDSADNVLYGTPANDRIDGLGGNDELRIGGGGQDLAYGGDGDDILRDDESDDLGGDNLQGNAGSDILIGGGGPDHTFGEDEIDPDVAIALGESLPATGARGDWVDGQRGDDTVVGEAGDDALWGGDGADVLIGGAGDDNIGGDLGTGSVLRSWSPQRVVSEQQDPSGSFTDYSLTFGDAFVAESAGHGGADFVWAGAGNDWAFAGEGDDYLDGGSGDDVLFGEAGDDEIVGGTGDDVLGGDSHALPGDLQGDDILFGNAGNDRLWGGGGSDYLVGGDGDDELSGDDPNLSTPYQRDDYLDGGAGNDRLTAGGGDDQLAGGTGNDVLVGEAGNDLLFGDDGDDELQGSEGYDLLFGGLGADRLYGGADVDELSGEDGDDYLSGDAGADLIYGGAGADQLLGGDGDDSLYGEADADALYGDAGNDRLDGGAGDDQLAGGDGQDALFGGEGNDLLVGAAGLDSLHGESGMDQLFGGDGTDLLHGGDDADQLYGNADDDLLLGDAGDDLLHGGDGNDALLAGDGANLLYGDAGNDNLYGGTGANELHGGDGDDALAGGAGNERLFGEGGADVLAGGAGVDELQGGAGDDRYEYGLGDGADRIFESADSHGDRIVFGEGIDAQSMRLAQQGSALVFLPADGFDDQLAVANWYYDASLRVADAEFADGTVWDATQLAQAAAGVHLFIGGAGNDTVTGTFGDDTLYGFAGDDVLNGGPGHDVLVGGAGNDAYVTGPGSTRILLSPGDGDDTLSNAVGGDVTLQFGSGVTASDLGFTRVDDDLAIAWDEVITIDGWFDGNTVTLEFSDGSVAPTDAEIARAAQDIAQSYAFERGSGTTTLQDWGGSDSVTFGAGIQPGDVTASRQGLDLVLTIASASGPSDVLIVQGWFDGVERQVEQFRFADSQAVLTADALTAPLLDPVGTAAGDTFVSGAGYVETLSGMAGDDTLTARGGGDTLIGGTGNDHLIGSDAQETCLFAVGDGQDIVQASAGFDTLQFDHPWSEITVSRDGADLVYTFAGSPSDSVRVQGYWQDTSRYDFRALATLRGTDGADTLAGNGQLSDALYGRAGDDTLSGGGGLDDLYGGAGNDTLDGGLGFDRLYGGEGDDVLGGGYGSDDYLSTAFDGGEGNYYDGGTGNDLYRGNRGRDAYFIQLSNGADVINQQPQLMDGGYYVSHGGDRLVFAEGIAPEQLQVTRSGADLVIAIDATNRVTVQGWFGSASTYYRIDSFDFIVDGVQQTLWTAADVTRLALTVRGSEGADSLAGTADDDALYGFGGDDVLSGLAGNDLLAGGFGDDRLLGGAGNDTYVFERGDGADIVDEQGASSAGDSVRFGNGISAADITLGRDGNALVLGLAGSADRLTIANALSQPASALEQFAFADGSALPDLQQIVDQLVNVRGTAADDALTGSAGIDRLYGFDGDDVLAGLGDADRLEGGAGNDVLDGGAGNDLLLGGEGDDLYRFAAGHGVDSLSDSQGTTQLAFAIGPDALAAEVAWSGNVAALALGDGASDKVVIDDAFADTTGLSLSFADGAPEAFDAWLTGRQAAGYVLTHTGTAGADTIRASEGVDSIDGGAGHDVIDAGGGDDTVHGGTGDDRIDGGAGSDTLSGDAGADTYVFGRGSGQDTVVESASSGPSTIQLALGTGLADLVIQKQRKDLQFTIDGAPDQLLVQNYSSGKVTLSVGLELADGRAFAAELLATQGAKVGSPGSETLRGGNGADRLYGLDGNDTLLGKGGDDWLSGGAGDDTLQGGAGADLYLLASGWGHDLLDEAGTDGAVDEVMFGGGIALDSLAFSRSGASLVVASADGSTLTIANWYADPAHQVERFSDADGHVLLNSQVDQLAQAMAASASPTRAFALDSTSASHSVLGDVLLAAPGRAWHDAWSRPRPCHPVER